MVPTESQKASSTPSQLPAKKDNGPSFKVSLEFHFSFKHAYNITYIASFSYF